MAPKRVGVWWEFAPGWLPWGLLGGLFGPRYHFLINLGLFLVDLGPFGEPLGPIFVEFGTILDDFSKKK